MQVVCHKGVGSAGSDQDVRLFVQWLVNNQHPVYIYTVSKKVDNTSVIMTGIVAGSTDTMQRCCKNKISAATSAHIECLTMSSNVVVNGPTITNRN